MSAPNRVIPPQAPVLRRGRPADRPHLRPLAAGPESAGPRPRPAFPTTAVLGAGHGGLALAAYLAMRGVPVHLWNRSPAPINAVELRGHIDLTVPPGQPAPLRPPRVRKATCSMSAALRGARAVLVALPAIAHGDVARQAAPYLADGQIVLLLPGRTGGALEFEQTLRRHGCAANVIVVEAQTFPFASRVTGPGQAAIHGIKRRVEAAALPAYRTAEALAVLRPLLPMLAPGHSVLHTSLDNMGAMLHPIITLLNAGRIEGREPFRFYVDGVTPAVAAVLAAADAERLAVARAYGVMARSLQEWLSDAYGERPADLRQAVAGNPAYRDIAAPTYLDHRYLREDVPTGLVPLVELGRAAGVACPTLEGLIHLAGALHGVNYQDSGRSLARLGLSGLTAAQVLQLVTDGAAAPVPPGLELPGGQSAEEVLHGAWNPN